MPENHSEDIAKGIFMGALGAIEQNIPKCDLTPKRKPSLDAQIAAADKKRLQQLQDRENQPGRGPVPPSRPDYGDRGER